MEAKARVNDCMRLSHFDPSMIVPRLASGFCLRAVVMISNELGGQSILLQ